MREQFRRAPAGGAVMARPPLWEALVDATWDDLAQYTEPVPPREARVVTARLLDGPADPVLAARQYENPVYVLSGRLGLEGRLYQAAVRAGVLPPGPGGVTLLRAAHQGATPMADTPLLTFLADWWHAHLVPLHGPTPA